MTNEVLVRILFLLIRLQVVHLLDHDLRFLAETVNDVGEGVVLNVLFLGEDTRVLIDDIREIRTLFPKLWNLRDPVVRFLLFRNQVVVARHEFFALVKLHDVARNQTADKHDKDQSRDDNFLFLVELHVSTAKFGLQDSTVASSSRRRRSRRTVNFRLWGSLNLLSMTSCHSGRVMLIKSL